MPYDIIIGRDEADKKRFEKTPEQIKDGTMTFEPARPKSSIAACIADLPLFVKRTCELA